VAFKDFSNSTPSPCSRLRDVLEGYTVAPGSDSRTGRAPPIPARFPLRYRVRLYLPGMGILHDPFDGRPLPPPSGLAAADYRTPTSQTDARTCDKTVLKRAGEATD
jgi:hypothetical protein